MISETTPPKIFLLIAIFMGAFACENEVKYEVSGEPIPIVYCLLNPNDDIQYVRLSKSFNLAQGANNQEINSDSLIWKNEVDIYVVKWENNDPVETYVFEESDVSMREPGKFPTDGLKVFQAEFTPGSGEEYHLFVYFPEIDKIVSGVTRVITIPEILDPEFVPARVVSFDTISPYYIRWKGGDYPGLYQGVFKMNYSESDGKNTEYKSCYFETPVYDKSSEVDLFEEKINGTNFFQSISTKIQVIPGLERELLNFEYTFYAGGTDLAILASEDLGVSNPFTIIRNISNIKGGNGVFSTLYFQKVSNLEASVLTKHLLATSEYTSNLGFKSTGL